ncbi:MAG TPA: T9SS type A sorting domain-containing protein [Bacteroidia bacterium]|nr:T9SS type A sorting domain-containing protein [Bacteroidia bacterium]HRH09778.1 T9SS type A sorting domain-containing protein [Bacteroidia bacterium]HRH64051.1 T9SS type A sorting domain-containing protein [Bacteroidia bacterium]
MNKTYDVSVAASTGGAYSPYGYACPVTINPIPTTGLISSNCGSTITNLNNPVTTNLTNICGVNDYKYEFKESGGSPIETTRNSSVATFLTVWIASPGVKYSTTYDVRVKLKIGNEWGEYGSTCSLSTGSSPLTELQSTYCSNYNLPSFSSSVACVAVPGAIDYKYHITGPNGYDKTFYKGNGLTTWIFSWTNAQTPHMAASTQYNVEVASNVGGVWSNYGNTCTINTPSSLRLAAQSSLTELNESIVEETVSELAMNVYPNPNSREGQLSIEISGINKIHLKLKISIYNLVGGNIYKSLIETNEENRFIIQPEIILPSGVYMVEAEVDGKVLRTKLVVE